LIPGGIRKGWKKDAREHFPDSFSSLWPYQCPCALNREYGYGPGFPRSRKKRTSCSSRNLSHPGSCPGWSNVGRIPRLGRLFIAVVALATMFDHGVGFFCLLACSLSAFLSSGTPLPGKPQVEVPDHLYRIGVFPLGHATWLWYYYAYTILKFHPSLRSSVYIWVFSGDTFGRDLWWRARNGCSADGFMEWRYHRYCSPPKTYELSASFRNTFSTRKYRLDSGCDAFPDPPGLALTHARPL